MRSNIVFQLHVKLEKHQISEWRLSFVKINFISEYFVICFQGPGFKKNYQIHLKSHSGPINVLLVNQETEGTSPVVVQVPPPENIMATATQNQNANPAGQKTTQKSAKVSHDENLSLSW